MSLLGWLLVNLAIDSSHRSLDDVMSRTPTPSDELLSKWQNDGAAQVFALYLGWIYSSIYFLISYFAVKLTAVFIKKISNQHEP